jgi:hypothetical protein
MNEAKVQGAVQKLIEAVIEGLDYSGYFAEHTKPHIRIQPNVINTVPDLGISCGRNHFFCGVVEVKKHNINLIREIFDSGGKGMGHCFDQLMCCSIMVPGIVFGLMTTFRAWRLLNTGDFPSLFKKCAEKHKEKLSNRMDENDSAVASESCPHSPERINPVQFLEKRQSRTESQRSFAKINDNKIQ